MKVFLYAALANDFSFWVFFGISLSKGSDAYTTKGNKTKVGSFDPTVPDGMDEVRDSYGTGSVFVFLAMFGGSTFILFLLCYFCQKKLQYGDDMVTSDRSTSSRQVFVIPSRTAQHSFRSVNCELATATPPPDYRTVVKKDCVFHDDPPPYEVAVFGGSTAKEQSANS